MELRPGLMRAVVAVGLLALAAPAMAEEEAPRLMTLSGEGQVEATPDMASVMMGVQSSAETARGAIAINSQQMRDVFSALGETGIEPRDIQTSNLYLQPQYEHYRDGKAPRLTGYRAGNSVTVRVRDTGLVGDILDTLTKVGINQINGINFGIQEPGPLIDEARKAAMADALRKARLYTEAAGIGLGRIMSISESGSARPPMPMAMARAESMDAGVPVAEGEVSLTARVSVTFELD